MSQQRGGTFPAENTPPRHIEQRRLEERGGPLLDAAEGVARGVDGGVATISARGADGNSRWAQMKAYLDRRHVQKHGKRRIFRTESDPPSTRQNISMAMNSGGQGL